jgi:UPF0716 protein FxsA
VILLLAFIAVPILEIALFIQVGGLIGLWPTLGVVVATAVAGAAVLRRQGVSTLGEIQTEMRAGRDPSSALANGALLLVAGLLLLTPGFFTDAVGLSLLAPPVRAAVIGWLGPRIAARVVVAGSAGPARRADPGLDAPIDVEYRDVTGDDDARR